MENNITPELLSALAACQAEINNITKENQPDGWSGIKLPMVIDAIKPVMATNGLSVMTILIKDGLQTIVTHQGGGVMVFTTPLTVDYDPFGMKPNSHAVLGAVAMFRKQVLMGLFNIAATDEEEQQQQQFNHTVKDAPVNTAWLDNMIKKIPEKGYKQTLDYCLSKFKDNQIAIDYITGAFAPHKPALTEAVV